MYFIGMSNTKKKKEQPMEESSYFDKRYLMKNLELFLLTFYLLLFLCFFSQTIQHFDVIKTLGIDMDWGGYFDDSIELKE